MSVYANKHNILEGFEKCEREIVNLRDSNRIMSDKLTLVDRLLGAVEARSDHGRDKYCGEDSVDILYNIRQTRTALRKEIAEEAK